MSATVENLEDGENVNVLVYEADREDSGEARQ
ncbi:hypothetical protein SAMN05920897_1404, partial [Alkalispirochaeta americana]